MKLKAFIKLSIKGIYKQLPAVIFLFAVFPIVFGSIIAYFQSDTFTPPTEIPRIAISLKDEDNSKASKDLTEFLNGEKMRKIIEIKEEEKVKLEIVIPKGYEKSLLALEESSIKIKAKNSGTKLSSTILASIIDKYNEEISQQYVLKRNIYKKDIALEQKQALLNEVNNTIKNIYSTDLIESNIVKVKKNLSSYEYFSVSMLGFMFMLLIMNLMAGTYVEKELGIDKRIMSTAITRTQYFNYGLVSCFMMAIFVNLVYVFTYRIMGISFYGSIGLLLLIVMAQSILATAIAGFFMEFFKKKSGLLVINVLFIFQIILGGTFFRTEMLWNSKLVEKLSSCSPDALITKSYKNFLIYNSFESIKIYLFLMILISIIVYGITVMKVKVNWRNNS